MPTERQTEPRSSRRSSARSGEPQRGSGAWRASCTPDWTRSSSRGGSPRAQAAGRAPTTTPTTARASRTTHGHRPARGLRGLGEPGRGQRPDDRAERAGEVQAGERRTTTTPLTTRTTTTPCAVRRTPSTAQPTAWPSAVAASTQASTTSCAPSRRSGGGDERGDGEQAPHLDEPGEVERGEQERAEVLGDRADRVDRRLAARQQLAAAAAAHRGADARAAGSRAKAAPRLPSSAADRAVEVRPNPSRRGRSLARRRRPRSGRGRRPGRRATAPRRRTVRARKRDQVAGVAQRRRPRSQSRRAR